MKDPSLAIYVLPSPKTKIGVSNSGLCFFMSIHSIVTLFTRPLTGASGRGWLVVENEALPGLAGVFLVLIGVAPLVERGGDYAAVQKPAQPGNLELR